MTAEDRADKQTEKALAQMERRLKKIYQEAYKEMSGKWEEFWKTLQPESRKYIQAIAEAQGLEERRKALKAYRDFLFENGLKTRRFTAMLEWITAELANVNQTALAYLNNELPPIYAINYNAAGRGIQTAIKGYSFSLVNADAVKNLVKNTGISLLPYKKLNPKKDKRWNTMKINSAILQGILQGESIPAIAARLSSVAAMNEAAAIRNARTMVTGAQNKGRLDGYRRAEDSGVKVQKRWDATLDSRTRHSHGRQDGELVGIDDKFSNGLRYPGDSRGKPQEVYNCRCRMNRQVGKGRGKERIARDKNGKSVLVPDMTWAEWIEWREKQDG